MVTSLNNRSDYIDSCRAIGIILVVLGHTYWIPNALYNVIYAFHMPLFFIISGFLYNKEKYNAMSLKTITVKKAKSYLIPYFTFAFVNLILQIIFKLIFNRTLVGINYILHNLKGIALCYSDMENMPDCSPIWFLVCLFVATLIFWAMIKYAERFSAAIAIACMFISYVMYLFADIRLPWKISTVFMAVFFMYLGYCCNRYSLIERISKSKRVPIVMLILLASGMTAGYLNGGNVGMNENTYGSLLLFLIGSVCLSLLMLLLCRNFSLLHNRFFIWLGQNTIYVMAFNYFMRDLTTEIYYLVPFIRNYNIHWTVSFVLIMIGCIAAIIVYKHLEKACSKLFKNAQRMLLK